MNLKIFPHTRLRNENEQQKYSLTIYFRHTTWNTCNAVHDLLLCNLSVDPLTLFLTHAIILYINSRYSLQTKNRYNYFLYTSTLFYRIKLKSKSLYVTKTSAFY